MPNNGENPEKNVQPVSPLTPAGTENGSSVFEYPNGKIKIENQETQESIIKKRLMIKKRYDNY